MDKAINHSTPMDKATRCSSQPAKWAECVVRRNRHDSRRGVVRTLGVCTANQTLPTFCSCSRTVNRSLDVRDSRQITTCQWIVRVKFMVLKQRREFHAPLLCKDMIGFYDTKTFYHINNRITDSLLLFVELFRILYCVYYLFSFCSVGLLDAKNVCWLPKNFYSLKLF